MKRISKPIETKELCSYGCGNSAKFINGSNKLMCCESSNSCPANKLKNSQNLKLAYDTGKRKPAKEVYENLPQETKENMAWSKGMTKETNSSVESMASKLRGREGTFKNKKHSLESKEKISKFRTEFLKNPENRKNLGRHRRSWMEIQFEKYLMDNSIVGWEMEKHFWSQELRKNYYVDFLFEELKLIIELDGTQHRNTIQSDSIRDKWFFEKGYKVVRIEHEEFKIRLFSDKGFLDLLGN